MNLTSLNSSQVYLQHMRTIAGVTYVVFGCVALAFVTTVHRSMRLIKEAQLGNRFYHYSWHCLVCDQLLIILGTIYGGAILIVQRPSFPPEPIGNAISTANMIIFDLKGLFLVLICWSRLESIQSNVIQSLKVRMTDRIICRVVWTPMLILPLLAAEFSCNIGSISLDELVWGFSVKNDGTLCGFFSFVVNYTYFACVTVCLVCLNMATVFVYQKKKKNFVTVLSVGSVGEQQLQDFYRRERNLFIQCTTASLAYLTCISSGVVSFQLNLMPNLYYHIASNLISSTVLVDTSVVYVLANRELRHQMSRMTWKKLFVVVPENS